MKNLIKRIIYRFRHLKNGIRHVTIKSGASVDLNNQFEGNNKIYKGCQLYSSSIGYGTYIAAHSRIVKTRIGRFSSIGANVQTYLGRHPIDFVTTHPAFFSTGKQSGITFASSNLYEEHIYTGEDKKFVVEIGNDVWIGNNVTILDGIKIGNGAIVATGAVVTKDIGPYEIWGGVPAKKIKARFDDPTIQRLLLTQWWQWDIARIEKESINFTDVKAFLELHDKD